MQFVGVAGALLIIAGGIIWYVYADHQERTAVGGVGRELAVAIA
jgi:hypothetical protein